MQSDARRLEASSAPAIDGSQEENNAFGRRTPNGRDAGAAESITAQVPILMYHSIDDEGPPELAPYRISPAAFASQMNYLAEQGFHSISLDRWAAAIAARQALPGRPVIITFDDGYANFLQNAWPAIEAAGLTATMFVVTDKAGKTADWDKVTGDHLPLMSWDELRRLSDRGLIVGSHSATHASLPTLSTQEIVEEGLRARARLHDELNIDVTSIAFPWGQSDERVRSALSEAGYSIGVSTWGGISTLTDDPLNLPRIEIFPNDDLHRFAAKLVPVGNKPQKTVTKTGEESVQSLAQPIPAYPNYTQKLASRLDILVGEFVALTNQILTSAGQPQSLQTRLTRIFRQPTVEPVASSLKPYETLPSGMCVGFEKDARVALEVIPKSDFSISPESCANTLQLILTGPSRWLSLEFPCEWSDITAAKHYQLGVYGTVNRNASCRGVLRLPSKNGKAVDVVFTQFQLDIQRRNLNKSGEMRNIDFVDINTDKRPTLFFDVATTNMPEFILTLNYLSLYFE